MNFIMFATRMANVAIVAVGSSVFACECGAKNGTSFANHGIVKELPFDSRSEYIFIK